MNLCNKTLTHLPPSPQILSALSQVKVMINTQTLLSLLQDLRYDIWVETSLHSWAVRAYSLLCVPTQPLSQMRMYTCNMVDYWQKNVYVFISYIRLLYNTSQSEVQCVKLILYVLMELQSSI